MLRKHDVGEELMLRMHDVGEELMLLHRLQTLAIAPGECRAEMSPLRMHSPSGPTGARLPCPAPQPTPPVDWWTAGLALGMGIPQI